MRFFNAIFIGALMVTAGCHVGNEPQPYPLAQDKCKWPSGMPMDRVVALTPDECKAILVARAALEGAEGREIHASFDVERNGANWSVTARYLLDPGKVATTGMFSHVVIGPDWSIQSIIGGA